MPLFTSFHITTALRKALASARYAPRTTKVQPKASFRARAQAYLRTVLQETFPTVTHDLQHGSRQAAHAYALQPIRLGSRNFTPQSARARLHTASRTFRSSYALPHAARAGRGTANVGIGTARGFASGAGQGQVYGQVQQHVPMGLRAFAALLSDEEHEKALPRASRVHPYSRRPGERSRRRATRMCHRQSVCSIDSRTSAPVATSALAHYFPTRPSPSVELPVAIETLVTPGAVTILSLPLSPSLSSLLDPTPRIPYADASIGVAVLSTLTSGVMSLQEAFGIHFADRILPLLAHIDALGVMQMEPRMEYEVVCDVMGRPDILRMTFHGRSEADVRRLLHGRLGDAGTGWYGLRQGLEAPQKEDHWALNNGEQREMMEDWAVEASATEAKAYGNGEAELLMPVLDIPISSDWPASHVESPPAIDESPEWPISTMSSPISGLDISSLNSAYTSGFSSPAYSSGSSADLDASLLSQLSAMERDSSIASWHTPPSEADSDVESAISAEVLDALSEVWDVEEQEAEQREGCETVEERVEMGQSGWIGSMYVWSGDGLGLAQPW